MTKSLKGGLILTEQSLSFRLSGFAPLLKMLLSSSAEIKLYTANSLTGFIFILNVENPNDSMYRHFRRINGGQNITNFIIKIVVIREQKQPLSSFKGIKKSSETESSFLTEARLQQTIWIRNIIGGKPEFSPSVANFALFEQAQSFNLLKCLGAKGDPDIMDVIHYLLRIDSLKLGVLLMPMIDNSVSLYNYVSNNTQPKSDEQKKTAYCHTIANIVKLFIIVNVVQFDLHPENAIIVDDDTEKSFLIDFGRASNIRKSINGVHIADSYLDVKTKTELYDYAKKCKDTFISMTGPLKRQTKRNYTNLQEEEQQDKILFMENICRTLTGLDSFINGERIQGDYKEKGNYQMSWMEQIYSSPDKDEIFLCAYEKLKRDYLTDSVTITAITIKQYITDGKLINLSKKPDSYYYVFPEDVVESLPELQVVAVPSLASPSLAAPRLAAEAQRNAFSSTILQQYATPGSTPGSTPGTYVDPIPGTLSDSFSREEDSSPSKGRPRIGGKTIKKNKKRKTRKIKSRRTKK